MPRKTALDAQVGMATEATYGTFVAPTAFHEWTEFGVKRADETMESAARRPGRRLQGEDRWDKGRTGAEGDIGYEVMDRGADALLLPCLGAVAHAQPDAAGNPSVWEHTLTLGDLDGLSTTVQVGVPDVAGVVQALSYVGGKAMSWELSNAVDDYLTLTQSWDFREELTDQPLGAATYGPGRPLSWVGAALTLAGSAFDVRSVSLSGETGLINDRFFLGDRRKKEQLEGGELRTLTGELAADFEGLTAYQRFTDGTTASLVMSWQGLVIPGGDGTFHYGVTITLPVVRFDGETPNPDDGVTEQKLPYKVLEPSDGSEPITVVVTDDIAGA